MLHPFGVVGKRLGDHANGLHLEARGLVLLARGVQEFDGLGDLTLVVRGIDADEGGNGAHLRPRFGKSERGDSQGEKEDVPHGMVIPRGPPDR